VAVAAADGSAGIAGALRDAINAQTNLPVTATAALGVVTVTARNKGVNGSKIDVRHSYYQGESLPEGVVLDIAAGVTGADNPDISGAIAAMADEAWVTIVNPWTDTANMALLETELATRWGPLAAGGEAEQMSGHAFSALDASHANLLTLGDARNSAHVTLWGIFSCPTWTCERAAILAGVVEYNGAIDPARPFQTLPLPGVLAPAEADRFTRQERDLLLHGGIATAKETVGGGMQIERVITTYQMTASGVPDVSLLDLNTKWTVDYIRYAVAARILQRFPRHKLADDGTRFHPGQAVATPSLVRAELLALFRDLEEAGLVENIEQYKQDLLVVRSTADVNRINAIIPPDIINQFMIFAAAVQFRL
jgi:phage tail sheath gpL-like